MKVSKSIGLPVDKTYSSHEKVIKNLWAETQLYSQLELNEKTFQNQFRFMDGPPFVSGTLHMGHLTIMSFKNCIQNYMRMQKYQVNNKLGYDCHGLPIEDIQMKKFNLNSSWEIKQFGIDKFNTGCKETIKSFAGSWEPLYELTARFNNPANSYMTLDIKYMETVWWIFKQIWDKQLVYSGFKVMPYSYGLQTPLSNFESKQKYMDIQTLTAYVNFKLKDYPSRYIVAWTTTPWTLLSNIALCVNPDFDYYLCVDESGSNEYIVEKNSIKNLPKYTKTEFLAKGKDLVGLEYIPLYNFIKKTYHKVIADAYVKESEIGTGIVHISPAHGEDDYRVCIENNIIQIQDLQEMCLVNELGKFNDNCTYANRLVFDCTLDIIKELKQTNLISKTQQYTHSYPHCYRTDTPLIMMPSSSFFINVSKIKDQLIQQNKKVSWNPPHIGMSRFNSWLEEARDWSVSRSRFFGTPIPVWASADGSEVICIGSIDELVQLAELHSRPDDIHREYMDKITIKSKKTGNILYRTEFVFDCWFESGCVPYAQIHYPFENSEQVDNCGDYLSDSVAEGLDQTRGWFYTLLVISTLISNKPPFKHVNCLGIVLDKTGLKLSKKYGNYIDPTILLETYGVDALRLYLLGSQLINAEPLLFDVEKLKECKQRIIPLINSVLFFLEHYENYIKTCSNSDSNSNLILIQYIAKSDLVQSNQDLTLLDKWILERMYKVRLEVQSHMETFSTNKAINVLVEMIDDITNWYLKFNRDRLKGLETSNDWVVSLSVLYTVCMDWIHVGAPFVPFIAEHLYMGLRPVCDKLFVEPSIHMRTYPGLTSTHAHGTVEVFEQIKLITKLIRNYRTTSKFHNKLKVPIKSCAVTHSNPQELFNIQKIIDLIQDEVNCLEFTFGMGMGLDIPPMTYTLVAKFDNKKCGQKFKQNASKIKSFVNTIDLTEYYDAQESNIILVKEFLIEGNVYNISSEDFMVQRISNLELDPNIHCVRDGELTLIINTVVDESTNKIYHMRSFSNSVQMARKSMGLRAANTVMIHCKKTIPEYWIQLFISHEKHFAVKLKSPIIIGDRVCENIFTYKLESKEDGVLFEFEFGIEFIN